MLFHQIPVLGDPHDGNAALLHEYVSSPDIPLIGTAFVFETNPSPEGVIVHPWHPASQVYYTTDAAHAVPLVVVLSVGGGSTAAHDVRGFILKKISKRIRVKIFYNKNFIYHVNIKAGRKYRKGLTVRDYESFSVF